MHYLDKVITAIDTTHPHLGALAAMCQIAIVSKKMLMIVSPRGCGKSRVTSSVGLSKTGARLEDRISVAGLMYLSKELQGFTSCIIVDDIAKAQSPYARITTITTLAELTYSHYCKSSLQGSSFEITDFWGSCLVNVQPIMLKQIVQSDEWEASIQDKSIRFYHLFRPQTPNSDAIKFKFQWGYEIDKVKEIKLEGEQYDVLIRTTSVQWGASRLREHLQDMLRSCAALDKRHEVNQSDIAVLTKILAPLALESIVLNKHEFEADRYLDSNMLAILTEYITYGEVTLEKLASDYKISETTCYRIMQNYGLNWQQVTKSPTVWMPSQLLINRLKLVGIGE